MAQGLKDSVEKQLKEILGSETELLFETEPNMVCGIELTSNGKKIAWSIADYLKSFAESLAEIKNQKQVKDKPESKTESKPEATA